MRGFLVEAVVIVVSIPLAFAIDAAWDARGERIETRSVLQDLESEFEENLALIDRIIGIREARALEAEGQLELIREPELTRPLTVFLNLVEDSFEDAAYRCFMEDRHGPTCPRPRPPT